MNIFVCLEFFVPLENFKSYRLYTITGENFDLFLALMTIEQRGFLSVHHLLCHESSVYNGHLQGPRTDTHTYCRAFGSRAVIACFNDLGLSRLGFEHPSFRLRRELNNPLRHRRGLMNEMRS